MQVINEEAQGEINGANTTFGTSFIYARNSLRVFLNGQLLRKDWENGWSELPFNQFKMKLAPVAGDSLQVNYLPSR